MIIDRILEEPKTLQFSLKAQEFRKQGRSIISLGLGEPEYDTPDHIKDAASKALAAGLTRYGAAPGLAELRDAVARKLREQNNIHAQPDQILILPGAKNALFVACAAVLHPGDEVLNLTPCYVSNMPIIKLAEPRALVRNIPLQKKDFRLDRDAIRQALCSRTRLLFTNYPNNPSGVMLDVDDAEFLREVVRAHDIVWLSDEIYECLALTQKQHISPASFTDIEEKIITVNGFSKSYSMTGWRIGYSCAAQKWTSLMTKIHQQLNTNTALFIQKAALAALNGPQDRLKRHREELRERAALLRSLCHTSLGLHCAPIEGGFFGFLDIGICGLPSDEFATELLCKTGVIVIPGVSFGEDFDNWVRVSLCASTDQVEEGLRRIAAFVADRLRKGAS